MSLLLPNKQKIMIIGIDFDNTIVSYDKLFYREAMQLGLIDAQCLKNKTSVRDHIRKTWGDVAWQKLQALVYGPKIGEAVLIPGVKEFLSMCKKHKVKVFIVSHKTEYASYDPTKTNLRLAALQWLDDHDFFSDQDFGLKREDFFFESNRLDKISRIKNLCCTLYIDDLEEIFLDESFDQNIDKILFAPNSTWEIDGIKVCTSWKSITEYVFRECGQD